MSRRLLRTTLLVGGSCLLLPNLGIAQAPPVQTDPQANSHVLRLPPSYNPAAPSNGYQTQPYDGSRYGGSQSQPYGGQPQQPQAYQGNGNPAPRYGTSLLGSPNFRNPNDNAPPAYDPGQSASLGNGTARPAAGGQSQPGSVVPPVQSPSYGDTDPYGSVAQPNPYVRQGVGAQPYGSQDPSITQQPLAPLPGTAPTQAQQPQPNDQPQTTPPGASPPAQLATPDASPDTQGTAGSQPPTGAEAEKNPAPTPAPALPNIWLPAGVAKLQALDKVNAQASTLSVKVGQSVTFGSLTITVKSCVVRPSDQPADAAAFVDVTDSHPDSTGFSGWLLENEPAVSIMQHPIYDLRVAGCA